MKFLERMDAEGTPSRLAATGPVCRTRRVGGAANRAVTLVSIAVLVVAGCRKPPAVSTTQPTTAPPLVQAVPATLDVGGEPTTFAVTHLDVSPDQSSLHIQLYGSDGAKEPVSTFYFNLTLDGDDPASLVGQSWRIAPSPEQDDDGSVGIFFNGQSLRLQPKLVEGTFSGEFPEITVTLKGTFLRDGDESKIIKASGTFTVHARVK